MLLLKDNSLTVSWHFEPVVYNTILNLSMSVTSVLETNKQSDDEPEEYNLSLMNLNILNS